MSPRPQDISPQALAVSSREVGTLVPHLLPGTRRLVRRIASVLRLTHQELRRVAETARDLEMWGEPVLERWWRESAPGDLPPDRDARKALLADLAERHHRLAAAETRYPERTPSAPSRRQRRLDIDSATRTLFGRCAAYSERTVCCRLHTLDAVLGCAFGCSYCTIQTFYGDSALLQPDLAQRLRDLELDRERFYHVGTGQASDSLVWGNRAGMLDALLDFARSRPNVLLELKTKSDNIGHLLSREPPGNVVCSWSLNTPVIVRQEEHGTASVERRLRAARAIADAGYRVAFHFHPMVYYRGWNRDYPALAQRLLAEFAPRETAFVSIGALTFIRPVAREIRRRGGETRILQMELAPDPHGRLTYPDRVKRRLFGRLYSAFLPWHQEVFFYLCMETESMWRQVLGRSFAHGRDFEAAFARTVGMGRCARLSSPLDRAGQASGR